MGNIIREIKEERTWGFTHQLSENCVVFGVLQNNQIEIALLNKFLYRQTFTYGEFPTEWQNQFVNVQEIFYLLEDKEKMLVDDGEILIRISRTQLLPLLIKVDRTNQNHLKVVRDFRNVELQKLKNMEETIQTKLWTVKDRSQRLDQLGTKGQRFQKQFSPKLKAYRSWRGGFRHGDFYEEHYNHPEGLVYTCYRYNNGFKSGMEVSQWKDERQQIQFFRKGKLHGCCKLKNRTLQTVHVYIHGELLESYTNRVEPGKLWML